MKFPRLTRSFGIVLFKYNHNSQKWSNINIEQM